MNEIVLNANLITLDEPPLKIMYTRHEDAGLSIVVGVRKDDLLNEFRNMNHEQLKSFFMSEIDKDSKNNGAKHLVNIQAILTYLDVKFRGIFDKEFEEEFYKKLIWSSVPDDAINPREINDDDHPNTREFRNAWCDVTPEPRVDIDLAKAKEIQLTKMREERQKKFDELGFPIRLSPELEAAIVSQENKNKLKALRDATEPLKALVAEGYNDETVLDQIRNLGRLNDV